MKEFWKYYYTVCDLCKRNEGIVAEENEPYLCKYNKNKSINYLEKPITEQRYKCKYFKRNSKIITSDFIDKEELGRTFSSNNLNIMYICKYKQGKFKIIKEE
ncbi:hypothetical protein [Clostridium perfringens]|uniref:hypothetical protein n=1 Tax=Clostridium perfringens TaxID=1502 RepID=UPI0024BC81E4|nr:hypothetical protein [Clostridium perfringens]